MKKLYGFFLVCTVAAGAFLMFPRTAVAIDATITITTLPPSEVTEGQGNLIFVLRRTGNLGGVTVLYNVTGSANNGGDYSKLSGSAAFFQGQETVNLQVTVVDDALPENDETVIVTIAPPPVAGAYQIGIPSSVAATIKDNEPVVTITSLAPKVFEISNSIVIGTGFKLTRTGPTTSNLPVDIQIGGTAVNGRDYNSIVSPVQIPANASEFTISFVVKDDLSVEPDETVIVTILPNKQRYKNGSPDSTTATIQDNDPPTISLAASDGTAEERDLSTAKVKVTRSGDAQQDVAVSYTVNPANQLITGTPATSDADFVPLSGSIVVPRNQTFAQIVITPRNDSNVEGTEKVLIHIAPASTYKVGANQNETISILDDDFPVVSIAATDGIASESGPDSGSVTFTRTGPASSSLTVRFTIATTGTNPATRDTDFKLPVRIVGNTVTIPSGQNSVVVVLTPVDDSQQEPQEQIVLSVAQDANYQIGSNSSATVFLADND